MTLPDDFPDGDAADDDAIEVLEEYARPLWHVGDPYPDDWVPANVLNLDVSNANHGDVEKIAESIRANGWYGRILVQLHSPSLGGASRILVGNHRYQAGLSLGMTHFPVDVIDCDDDAAATKISTADNRYGEFRTWDVRQLVENLSDLPDLDGTGFTDVDLESLRSSLEMPDLSDDAKDHKAPSPDVTIKVGTISFDVTREAWDAFESRLTAEVGNRHEDQVAEVRVLLQL